MSTEDTAAVVPPAESQAPGAPGADALLSPPAEQKPPAQSEAPKAEAAAPDAYDFKFADGVEINKDSLAAFTELAKAEKLPADLAQKLADFAVQDRDSQTKAWVEQQKQTVDAWQDELYADPTLGGDKFAESIATARKAFELLPDTARKNPDGTARPSERAELKTLLEQSGLYAHPSMVRIFHAVGKGLSEDTFVPGGKKPDGKPFYENSSQLI